MSANYQERSMGDKASLGQGMGQFLDSIPPDFRDPATFQTLREAADLPDFAPQHVAIIDTCLRDSLASGSQVIEGPRPFLWPADHGMHADVANEWYFLVSNLTIDGPQPGRIAIVTVPMRYSAAPPTLRAALGWTDLDAQVIDSLLKLTIVTDGGAENVVRQWNVGAGLTGELELSTTPFVMVTGGDRLEGAADEPFPMRTHYDGPYLHVDLEHERGAPYFFQGSGGYLPTAWPATSPGYLYYSAPHIRTKGTIVHAGTTYEVSGVSWFDHQWGTAAPARPDPSSTRSGWVWFGFNFDDGSALTFASAHETNVPDPNTFKGGGKYVPPATGDVTPPPAGPVEGTPFLGVLTVTDHFTSPTTGVSWPCGWEFEIDGISSVAKISATAWAKDQLGMFASLQEFWEGGADLVKTDAQGNEVRGQGFCEAVGFEPFDSYWQRVENFLGKNESGAG
jgi:predicted secreted hydrolase